jgi:two-component system phosphate regulon sensor histidine kinase PhoR
MPGARRRAAHVARASKGAAVKAGKVFSLGLVVLTTLLAVVVHAATHRLPGVESLGALWSVAIHAGAFALVIALVLVPVGVIFDRSLGEVRRYIESDDAAGSTTYNGPKWLQSITSAFTAAVDRFRQREQSLRHQIRELEIRQRVTEAERRQVEAVLHVLRDAVIVTDAFNEVVMANESAAGVLGFDLDDALHKRIDALVSDEELCRLINDVRESGDANQRKAIEHELAAADRDQSTPTVFAVVLAPVLNHKQEVAGVVTILHDLTRERELAQMKTDFVSKASHELRTPLSSIRAYVEMLVDGEATDEESRREFYQIIHNETDRLGRLIDNMLNISRIEAGIVQIEREQVDIKTLIDRAVDTIEPQARDREITINTKLAAVDLCVEGDADMLYQVVLNLMSNAVKYTPQGGRVTLSADSDNLTRSVVVSVADTGFGIPPDALPRLFEKFFRVENYKRVAKGTGLGLSLCKHIVETVHHGQIGVESELGMGSKFWFTVPMRYAGSRAAA